MANIYLDSTVGGGGGTGVDWANAYTTLAAAIADPIDSTDTIWVKKDHFENLAGHTTYTFPADPGFRLMCVGVTTTNDPPIASDLAIMANDGTEGWSTDGDFLITLNGVRYEYGVAWLPGDGTSGASAKVRIGNSGSLSHIPVSEKTTFGTLSTHGSANLLVGLAGRSIRVHWIDCTTRFSATGQSLTCKKGDWLIQNLSIVGTAVASLFDSVSEDQGRVEIQDSDLSTNGPTVSLMLRATSRSFLYVLATNCKIPDGIALVTGSDDSWAAGTFEIMNSDFGDTNYRYGLDNGFGTIDSDTAIVRTGGASDGVTAYSHKYVTNSNPNLHMPLEGKEIAIWNEVLAEVTVKIQITTDNITLQDDEIWLEVQYPGDASDPQGSLATDRVALLATPADQESATEVWSGQGGWTAAVDQVLVVTLTPLEIGFLQCRVMMSRQTATTTYVDPLPVVEATA